MLGGRDVDGWGEKDMRGLGRLIIENSTWRNYLLAWSSDLVKDVIPVKRRPCLLCTTACTDLNAQGCSAEVF
jgi:hypothetical protein